MKNGSAVFFFQFSKSRPVFTQKNETERFFSVELAKWSAFQRVESEFIGIHLSNWYCCDDIIIAYLIQS